MAFSIMTTIYEDGEHYGDDFSQSESLATAIGHAHDFLEDTLLDATVLDRESTDSRNNGVRA